MVFNSTRVAENTNDLRRVLQDLRLWEFDLAAATEFGRIKSELRRVGRPIPDVDVQIAAVARCNGLSLLSADAHFASIAGLTVEDWTTALPIP
jgi:tRNA(fMet)-specific endonuclease VapC